MEQTNEKYKAPCHVGDTVYQHDDTKVYAAKVKNIYYDLGFIAFDESAIGKSVFLTYEEAEKSLEERKRQNEKNR